VTEEYLQVLSDSQSERFRYSVDGVTYKTAESRKTPFQIANEIFVTVYDNPAVTDIAIPYDNREHHVVIYIDRTAKRVEYYDPYGVPAADKRSSRGLPFNMRDHIEAIQSLYFGTRSSTLVENRVPHQECFFRCAIWGLRYIELRLARRPAEELCVEQIPESAIEDYRREVVAKRIELRALSLLETLPKETNSNSIVALDDFEV
jgi:hypothetical protein